MLKNITQVSKTPASRSLWSYRYVVPGIFSLACV